MTKQSENIPQHTQTQGAPVPYYAGYPAGYADDEISLIDLAKILIRNFWVVILGLLVCVSLAWFAAPKDSRFDYVTLIGLGIGVDGLPVESNAAVEAQLTSVFLPRYTREFLASNPELERLGFKVTVDSLRDTAIVRIMSTATVEGSARVESLHSSLAQEVVRRHNRRIDASQTELESRIEELQRVVGGSASEDVVAAARVELSDQRANLRNLEESSVLALAEQSLEPVGRGLMIYLALGVIVGLMGGVVGAFFWEFAVKVRESMKEDAANQQSAQG